MKLRIVRHQIACRVWYTFEKRFLFFWWHSVYVKFPYPSLPIHVGLTYSAYEDAKKDAMEYIHAVKNKKHLTDIVFEMKV